MKNKRTEMRERKKDVMRKDGGFMVIQKLMELRTKDLTL
jgi:hypothetical protein